jgi:hypothetical protein
LKVTPRDEEEAFNVVLRRPSAAVPKDEVDAARPAL